MHCALCIVHYALCTGGNRLFRSNTNMQAPPPAGAMHFSLSQQCPNKVPVKCQQSPSKVSAKSQQSFSKVSAKSQQHPSKCSNKVPTKSQQSLSKVSAKFQQSLCKVPANVPANVAAKYPHKCRTEFPREFCAVFSAKASQIDH